MAIRRRFNASVLMIFLLLSSTFFASFGSVSAADASSMPIKQDLELPFDTSLEDAAFHPVDMRVQFDQSAWAQNETIHSVRVGFDDGSGITDIECQIYDLEYVDDSHISGCGLVFLIPEEADGSESYFVCYSGSQTDAPNFVDHVSVEDATYFYEPISGQKIDIEYYKISDDGNLVYAVCQKGELIGSGMGQVIIKMNPTSAEFETGNIEQLSSFYMAYSIDPAGETAGTMWPSEVSKSILVDGNLMTRVKIDVLSREGNIRTDNIYTFYHCPTQAKSIDVNVNHEFLESVEVSGSKQKDGVLGVTTTFKARSATIDSLNIGNILPQIHVYTEDEIIKSYDVPLDPDANPAEWLLGTNDDIDLGSHAWVSMDDPDSGKAHAMLFESQDGYIGDETDGLQVKVSTKQHVKLPGLEADTGDVYVTRNAFEGGSQVTTLEQGLIFNYDARFCSLQTGGFEKIDGLSQVYQPFAAIRPISRGNVSTEPEIEIPKYTLTAFVKGANAVPLGPLLSAATGKSVPYIYAELYRDGGIKSSGSVGRLPMGDVNLEFDNTSLVEKVKLALGIFDWKNFTLKKKIRFPNVEDGTYLVKVFLENPLFGKDRQYIGYNFVEINGEDTSVTVSCEKQGSVGFDIFDDKGSAVKDVLFTLYDQDIAVSEQCSDVNGSVVLNAPAYRRSPYTLKVLYDGFLIFEREISLGRKEIRKTSFEELSIDLVDVKIYVEDTLGLAPAVDLNPTMVSSSMIVETALRGDVVSDNGFSEYVFEDLYPASYSLSLGYKSFDMVESVSVSSDRSVDLVFPAEFPVELEVHNIVGSTISSGEAVLSREEKYRSVEIDSEGMGKIVVPPGEYVLEISDDDGIIANQAVSVKGDKAMTIVSGQQSSLHFMVTILGALICLGGIVVLVWKRQLIPALKILAIGLLVLAIVSPWWVLSGSSGGVETQTQTLLIPEKMVTFTDGSDGMGGDISSLPEEATMMLGVIGKVLIASVVVIGLLVVWSLRFESLLPKLRKILGIVSVILPLLGAVLFVVVMSMIAEAGVGTLSGAMDLDISIPGASSVSVPCSWGLASGFYLAFVGVILLLVSLFERKLERLLIRWM